MLLYRRFVVTEGADTWARYICPSIASVSDGDVVPTPSFVENVPVVPVSVPVSVPPERGR